MNKKLLTFALLLLLMLVAVVPVMAKSAKRVPVTSNSVRLSIKPGEPRITDGIVHRRGTIVVYSVTLNVLDDPPYTLTGISNVVRDTEYNQKTGQFVMHDVSVWTFPGGTFEGIAFANQMYAPGPSPVPPVLSSNLHWVAHGTGAFEGQTLFFPDTLSEGYLFTP